MPTPQPDETHDEFIKRCISVVIEDGTAENGDQAVAICNSIWEQREKEGEMEDKAITKSEADGDHPASHYLIIEDPKSPSTWHLRVRNMQGDYDHGLCGAAWAALHEGYRGNRYEGPGKQEAIAKLKRIYVSQKWELPGKGYAPGETKLLYGQPVRIEEIKAAGDDWLVEGYVSTFGNVDMGNDVVLAGAFTDTLKSGPKVRFLLSHDPRLVLGVPKLFREDRKGLFGSFKISKTQLGGDTHQLLLDGAIDSFSIGYQAVDWEIVDENVRQLKKVSLFEASLVPMAMNPEALVTNVKEYMTLADRTSAIVDDFGSLLNDLRGLSDKGRPLNEVKRQELMELLEMFSGLDDVRTDIQSILTAAPVKLVGQRLIRYQLAEKRKQLARKNIIEE